VIYFQKKGPLFGKTPNEGGPGRHAEDVKKAANEEKKRLLFLSCRSPYSPTEERFNSRGGLERGGGGGIWGVWEATRGNTVGGKRGISIANGEKRREGIASKCEGRRPTKGKRWKRIAIDGKKKGGPRATF